VGKPLLVFLPQILGYHGKVNVRDEDAVTNQILDFYGGKEKILEDRDGLFEVLRNMNYRCNYFMNFQASIIYFKHANRIILLIRQLRTDILKLVGLSR